MSRHDGATVDALLARLRATLLRHRDTRVRPGRDGKILADWNALTVIALCPAAAVFQRPDWAVVARRCWEAVEALLGRPDGRLDHA